MAVDAAILFSDIMVPLAAVGRRRAHRERAWPGRGRPHPDARRRRAAPPARARDGRPDVLEAIRLLRKELTVPLIGFAGAPFTLASYLVEGGPSRTHERTKALMLGDPAAWDALMAALVAIVRAAPPCAGRRRRAGVAGLRLVGGGARPRCSTRRSVFPHMRRSVRRAGGPRRPHDPFRCGDR